MCVCVYVCVCVCMCNPGRADKSEGESRWLCVDPDMIPTAMGSHLSEREARLICLAREARQTIRQFVLFLVGRDGSAWIPKAMGYNSRRKNNKHAFSNAR